ncbi:TIGR01666 family membrane protein [Dyella halodurans]|uniref:YccS family putative transporter n=1 Tax=Dyella halodurans TaxID=1920171 RepID=A0ABV9C5A5_9GAMM|nr:YccS family putative transporter [Dyella halodurans]
MPAATLAHRWRRLRGSDRFAECLRVLFALGGAVGWCFATSRLDAVSPALLGVIACALAETEDHWRNRLTTLLVTLACFALSSFAVQWLFPYPVLFALGLPLATFVLVMLGAISERYATVAGATLLLAVYTMIGADQAGVAMHPWHQPLILLLGAAWYGLLSLGWSVLAPQQAVRHSLARLFDALADFLTGKAALFTPVHGVDREALQLALAMKNERVVEALNDTRLVLIDRMGARRPRGATAERLRLYFMAQDIHERISSAHYPYDALAEALFHSDVLFRCEHLLQLEARNCSQHAEALRLRTQAPVATDTRASARDLQSAVVALRAQVDPPAEHLLRSLDALVRNLLAIQAQLQGETPVELPAAGADSALQNPSPQTPGEAWTRIRLQLTRQSFRFRHALRLAVALLVGYAVLHAVHPRHGYWILLTTLLVCQPSYGATRIRLVQRVSGTLIGLVLGWATLRLLPFGPWQMPLIVASGVMFFAARLRRYTTATAAITLFVVLCFNQVGNGYEVMWPRLLDTLIGAAIAALAMHFILPDWQGRRFDDVLADTVRSDARYLAQIMAQYASGRRDDLDYRVARREAHNANATLSNALAKMLREPGRHRGGSETLLRFLATSHVLLGQLSALGANRQAMLEGPARETVIQVGGITVKALEQLAQSLANRSAMTRDEHEQVSTDVPCLEGADDETARLVIGQLTHVLSQRDRLAALSRDLATE